MSNPCNLCEGTGKLPTNPYREAPMKQEETPKSPPWYRRLAVRIPWKDVGIWSIIGVAASFVLYGAGHLIMTESVQKNQIVHIKAQYDDKGKVVRCWVEDDHETHNHVKLSDHYGTQTCDNKDNPTCMKHAAFALGVEDYDSCIWIDKEGK